MSQTLQILLTRFNGALLVRPVVAGHVINMAKQSVYNCLSMGTFPLPVVETATGRMVRVNDIANYIDRLTPTMPTPDIDTPTNLKGRPKKVVQLAAKKLGISVPEYYVRKGAKS